MNKVSLKIPLKIVFHVYIIGFIIPGTIPDMKIYIIPDIKIYTMYCQTDLTARRISELTDLRAALLDGKNKVKLIPGG